MKRFLSLVLSVSLILSLSVSIIGCGGASTKAEDMIEVIDGTLASANYVLQNNESLSLSASAHAEELTLPSESFSELLSAVTVDENDKLPMTESNKNGLKGEAVFDGLAFSTFTRAFLSQFGDEVFTNVYFVQGMIIRIEESDGYVVNLGLIRDNVLDSIMRFHFKEVASGEYVYTQIIYDMSPYGDPELGAELRISCYNSQNGMMRAELDVRHMSEFAKPTLDYTAYELEKLTVSDFSQEYYISHQRNDQTTKNALLDFMDVVLGFNSEVYEDSCTLETDEKVEITSQQLAELNAEISKTSFVYDDGYSSSEDYVRETYSIPSNVTVVKTASIPATKKLIIHKNVTTIETKPFQKPHHLEEIIFEDAENGALTTIGSFNYLPDTFILSGTKVKNFTLPKTVTKLEFGNYSLETYVENLDLSSYKYNSESQSLTLTIQNADRFYVKEYGYIENFFMPQFDLGISYGEETSDCFVALESGEDVFEICFHDILEDVANAGGVENWREQKGYEYTEECIENLYVHNDTELLDVMIDPGDKRDPYKRKQFPINMYSDGSMHAKGGGKRKVNTIYVPSRLLEITETREAEGYDNLFDSNGVARTTIMIR